MIDVIQSSLFYQLAALLVLAGIMGFIALKLRQPLVVAFIALGLIAGPGGLGLVNGGGHFIETLAELGITLLLFMVGLKLDVGLIKRLGPAALTTGLIQVILTTLLGGTMILLLGYSFQAAFLAGIALSFSSTIIVVKLLSDKRAIDSLYGKMALGILIVQDIVVILAMVAITALGSPEEGAGMETYGLVALKIFVLMVLTGMFIRFIANPLTRNLSRAPELMMIFAIGLAAVMAAICHYMELSKELGGLLAGVALASTPYHNVIAARLSPLRDFLLLFFFIGLGAHMDTGNLGAQIIPALVLSAFVLLVKPAIIMTVMTCSGYRKRTGFMTGVSLAQISEFSLIFIAMAAGTGLVPPDMLGLLTLTGLITIALSCYAIIYNTTLHNILERALPFMEQKNVKYPEESEDAPLQKKYDVIIFGLGRYGNAMAQEFQERGAKVLGIDFDPAAIKNAEKSVVSIIYGDASDPEFAAGLPLETTKIIVFAFHHYFTGPLITDLRRTLAKILREHGYKGHIVVTSHHPEHDQDLEKHGIDIVLSPFEDAALHGASQIMDVLNKKSSRH